MPLFPLGTIGLNSSESEQTIARASVGAWGEHLNWRTLDSARQFAAAARIGFNGSETLAALISVLAPPDDGCVACCSVQMNVLLCVASVDCVSCILLAISCSLPATSRTAIALASRTVA